LAAGKAKEARKPPLPTEQLLRAVGWLCSPSEFQEWLIRTRQGYVLHAPAPEAEFITTTEDLTAFVQVTARQKDNLASVEAFKNPHSSRISFLRIVSPTRQVHIIDLIAFRATAALAGAGIESLRELLEGCTRKCGWDLAGDALFWADEYGIQIRNAIELLPCCQAYFPLETDRDKFRSDAAQAHAMAKLLCPETWEDQPTVDDEAIDWDTRPMTPEMEYALCYQNVGMLLDIRKAVRARVMKKMEEQMAHVSETYLKTGKCHAARRRRSLLAQMPDGEPSLADTMLSMELAHRS
jgi:hypothetical protein